MRVISKYEGFRWLWIGQLLSQLGTAVFLVMGLWEIQLRSPFLLSIAGLAMMIPSSLAVFGGVIVDRYDPGRLMLWTDVLRGLALGLGVAALYIHGALIAAIIILLGINSLGGSLFSPAEGVLVPRLVADGDLPAANGLYSVTYQLAEALGAAVGGAAIAA
ncbi:MAG: MFS transporter, partial [Clostridia bacterium]